jgi:Transcriptional regulator, AbiEi antitoxin, Type IV TA system/Transcriptional regulator, AbiEi antitoxin N-terminal domain
MDVHPKTKINALLQSWPSGTVGLSVWLEKQGVSRQLQRHYQKSGWFESLGRGAFRRAGDTADWLGALYALQKQGGLDIHAGGQTALGLLGQAHYLELNAKTVQLFAPRKTLLPAWFRNHDWGLKPELHNTNFLPAAIGLVDVEHKLFTVKASGTARAVMECLYLAPEKFDLVEAYQIMEGLGTLRPAVVQTLMEQCGSVKVKRLFLYMAGKAGHAWVKHLDRSKVDFGSGKRSVAPGGVYAPKYEITVPKELAES